MVPFLQLLAAWSAAIVSGWPAIISVRAIGPDSRVRMLGSLLVGFRLLLAVPPRDGPLSSSAGRLRIPGIPRTTSGLGIVLLSLAAILPVSLALTSTARRRACVPLPCLLRVGRLPLPGGPFFRAQECSANCPEPG